VRYGPTVQMHPGPSLGGWHLGTCQGLRAPKGPRAAAVIAATGDGSISYLI